MSDRGGPRTGQSVEIHGQIRVSEQDGSNVHGVCAAAERAGIVLVRVGTQQAPDHPAGVVVHRRQQRRQGALPPRPDAINVDTLLVPDSSRRFVGNNGWTS